MEKKEQVNLNSQGASKSALGGNKQHDWQT